MGLYTGDQCQYHVCSVEDYCLNGGTCYEGEGGNVSCICPHPYLGQHCDVDRCDVSVDKFSKIQFNFYSA